MKRPFFILCLLVALALLVGCGSPSSTGVPPTSSPPKAEDTSIATTIAVPTDTPLPLPSATPAPEPTATWIPTLTPVPSPAFATPSADLLNRMDGIEAEVEELRGLDESTPITRTVMTRQELAAYTERQFEEDYTPDKVATDVYVLAAFDFVPENYDLRGTLVDLYSNQVVGLYDDDEKALYLVTDAAEEFDIMTRMTFAHEFTHGLQDQNFGLEAFTDEDRFNDDTVLAHLALVEGDATLAMSQYLYAHLSELTDEDIQSLQGEGDPASQQALDAAPAIIRETFTFPYFYGLEFASALQERGWDAVDAAYADPPQSTEQILHPDKYLIRDAPTIVTVPPLTDTLGAGWQLVESETLGEFQTGLYLAQQVGQEAADLASAGWDGDQYSVYVKDQDLVLVFSTVWDSPQDRQEFVDAYAQYAAAKYGQPPAEQGESQILWRTADQAASLSWRDATALLILAPDFATIEKLRDTIR